MTETEERLFAAFLSVKKSFLPVLPIPAIIIA